nr:hypothetical protein [Tanacetum cinerariifolium]
VARRQHIPHKVGVLVGRNGGDGSSPKLSRQLAQQGSRLLGQPPQKG